MRRLLALVLLPAVLAQGCATTASVSSRSQPAASAGPSGTDPARLAEINEDLAGEPATVELTSGEVVRDAQSVTLGPQDTSWRDAAGKERTVPTAEVRRVLREQHHQIGRGLGYGALAAIVPAYFVAKNAECHHNCGDEGLFSGLDAFAASFLTVVAGGLIGMLVAAATRHPVVAYAAPAARSASLSSGAAPSPGPAAEMRCHLAPSTRGDGLACAPLSR